MEYKPQRDESNGKDGSGLVHASGKPEYYFFIMKKNIIACAESAAAELLEISEDLSLEEMRDRLQEAINLLNEADCDLIKLKEEIYE